MIMVQMIINMDAKLFHLASNHMSYITCAEIVCHSGGITTSFQYRMSCFHEAIFPFFFLLLVAGKLYYPQVNRTSWQEVWPYWSYPKFVFQFLMLFLKIKFSVSIVRVFERFLSNFEILVPSTLFWTQTGYNASLNDNLIHEPYLDLNKGLTLG